MIVNSSYLSLELISDKKIKNTYKIDKINNYKILAFTEDEEIEILAIDVDFSGDTSRIIFTTRDCIQNKKYKLKLMNGFKIQYEDESYCEETEFDFISTTERPTILDVVPTSPVNMIVHFTKEMNFNNDILNKKRYIFINNDLKVISVEQEGNSAVKLLTSRQMPGKIYQLKVI